MFCTQCGIQNADTAVQCLKCGMSIAVIPPQPPPSYSIDQDPGMRVLLPVGRSVCAIVAGYLGLFSVLALPAPLALFCGIMGIIDIRKNPEKHGMGRCIFAVIMGGLFTPLLLLFLVAAIVG